MQKLIINKIYFYIFCTVIFTSIWFINEGGAIDKRTVDEPPIIPKSKLPSREIIVASVNGKSTEEEFALRVLQGLVNRQRPLLYITGGSGILVDNKTLSLADSFWLKKSLSRTSSVRFENDLETLATEFHTEVHGCVLYDEHLWENPSKMGILNVIMLECSIDNLLPLTVTLEEKCHLPIRMDTRGKWEDSAGAYEWAFGELWPKANHTVLAYLHPKHLLLMDYLTEFKILPMHVDSGSESLDKIWKEILISTPPNIPVLGVWGGSWDSLPHSEYKEAQLVQMCSQYAKFFVVASDCGNLSLHSGYQFTSSAKKSPGIALLGEKVYITFGVSDGDNINLNIYQRLKLWGNNKREIIPLGWSVNLLSADLCPDILEYYITSATSEDGFLAAYPGVGYIIPGVYALRFPERQRKEIWNNYLNILRKYYLKVNVDGVWFIEKGCEEYAQQTIRRLPFLEACFWECDARRSLRECDFKDQNPIAIPSATRAWEEGYADPRIVASKIKENTPKGRPAFIFAAVNGFVMGPEEVGQVLSYLGSEYEAVRPNKFKLLLKKAQENILKKASQ